MNKLFSVVLLCSVSLAFAQSTNFATRVTCEVQSAYPELRDLVWLQGTTPAVQAVPLNAGKPLSYDASTSVRMVIGPTATGTNFAVRTNAASVTNGYTIQWPTIGTNSYTNAWFYTLLFDREGQTYWSGSGKLYIDETTSTASNGIDWIEYTIPNVAWENIVGDASNNASLVAYVESHSGGSAVDSVARAGVASNTANIVLASNVAATAYGWGNHATSNYLSRYSSNTVVDAGTNALFRNAGGQRYFVNNSSASGDLLFSETTSLELDMNDGDIDGISDLQVATISKRPGGEAPVFPDGFSIGGTTYTNLNLSGGDASAWSGYPATNALDINGYNIDSVARIETESVAGIPEFFGGLWLTESEGSANRVKLAYSNYPPASTGTGATFTVEGGTNVTVATNGNAYIVSSSGGGGISITQTAGAEGLPHAYSFSTNIQLVAGTNAWNQIISGTDSGITQTITITPPTNSAIEDDVLIWLRVPPITTNAITVITTGVAEVRGSIPIFRTNDWTEIIISKRAGTNFYGIKGLY